MLWLQLWGELWLSKGCWSPYEFHLFQHFHFRQVIFSPSDTFARHYHALFCVQRETLKHWKLLVLFLLFSSGMHPPSFRCEPSQNVSKTNREGTNSSCLRWTCLDPIWSHKASITLFRSDISFAIVPSLLWLSQLIREETGPRTLTSQISLSASLLLRFAFDTIRVFWIVVCCVGTSPSSMHSTKSSLISSIARLDSGASCISLYAGLIRLLLLSIPFWVLLASKWFWCFSTTLAGILSSSAFPFDDEFHSHMLSPLLIKEESNFLHAFSRSTFGRALVATCCLQWTRPTEKL